AKWRDVPRRRGPNWERGGRQAGGSGATRWRPRESHPGNRKPGDRFQERRGLRLKRDLRKPPRAGWTAVTDGKVVDWMEQVSDEQYQGVTLEARPAARSRGGSRNNSELVYDQKPPPSQRTRRMGRPA